LGEPKQQTIQGSYPLLVHQPDPRIVQLISLASLLNESEPSDQAVSTILSAQTFLISEGDAVLVIDNMTCAENAVFALRWFLKSIQHNKEVWLFFKSFFFIIFIHGVEITKI
jgi:hypothetical protein